MADTEARGVSSAGEDEGSSPMAPDNVSAAGSAGDSVDQIDENGIESSCSKPNETRAAEDGGREDMFVDCPDEIENSESQQNSEDQDNSKDDHSNETDSGINVQQMVAEMELLRDTLAEKDRFAQEYEKERAAVMRELTHLRYQVKVMNRKQPTPAENNDGLDMEMLDSTAPLHEMISECSRLLDKTVDEHLQTERKVQELHSVLDMKNQEIDSLRAKVDELSESSQNFQSNSENLSQLYESQLENHKYVEECVNRMIASLSMQFNQEEFLNGSITDKISVIEQSVVFFIEKYNVFIYGTDQLKKCLTEVGSYFDETDDNSSFVAVCDKFLELRQKEENLYHNLSNLEDENRKLVEQLEKQRSLLENSDVEIKRLSADLELEKNRCANSKEKLSMAVTKGKALVQQRDSLKQQLAEKTTQLEKCLTELKEKSSALEAAEQLKEAVAAGENNVASLQKSLYEKDMIIQKCGEILSGYVTVEELRPPDVVEMLIWLVEETKSLKDVSVQYHKLTYALSLFDFPETVASFEPDSRISWLVESFHLSKQEVVRLQFEIAQTIEVGNGERENLTFALLIEALEKNYLQAELEDLSKNYDAYETLQQEMARTREAANNEIERLTKSTSAESQEKIYLQAELEDLRLKYEGVVQKEHGLSLEKDQIVKMVSEASGISTESPDDIRSEQSDVSAFINNCLGKIKEKAGHLEPSQVNTEFFTSLQSLLYIRDQEMSLYKLVLEEDITDRIEVNRLSNELEMSTQELNAVKDEKAVMKESLEQLEDRCALLKDKLSMAVKKGKGLVQERENLKSALNEKNSEIDRLKSELQQNVSTYNECQEKIALDVERISQLESDVISAKEHGDQLGRLLAQSNDSLQRIVESIEDISNPVNLVVEDPVEKVKWLAGYISEKETAKAVMEQELEKVKDEATSLADKLSEEQKVMKSLEDALSVAQNNLSELLDEKKALEEDFQKEKDEVSLYMSKFEEMLMSKRSLEDALSTAENKISHYMNEIDIAEEGRVLAEEQLQKLKTAFSNHMSKFSDSEKTIRSLEDALSQAQKNVSLLTEENNRMEIGKVELENEIKKIREEADSQASQLADASSRMESLQDSLSSAENNMENLVQEKKIAEEEIFTLKSQLKTCMDELAGAHGSIENRSLELSGQLGRLKLLLKDEALSSSLEQCFEKNLERLNQMDSLLKEISEYFLEMGLDEPVNGPVLEDGSSTSSTVDPDINLKQESSYDETNSIDGENLVFHIEKLNESFRVKGKMLADKVSKFSTKMDEVFAVQLRRLQITKDRLTSIVKSMKSLDQQVKEMEEVKQRQEDAIASSERERDTLLAACTDAARDMELSIQKNISELGSIQGLIKLDDRIFKDLGGADGDSADAVASDHVKTAVLKLSLATRHNQDLGEMFQHTIKELVNKTEDMQNNLQEYLQTCDEVTEERDKYKDRISMLENDLEEQKNLYQDAMLKLDDYREKEKRFITREAELSNSLSKVQEMGEPLLLASQIKSVLDKISEIEIPDDAFVVGEPYDSDDARKLLYVIDSFNGSLQRVSSLSHEMEKLHSVIEKQTVEIEFLKTKVQDHLNIQQDLDKMKNDLLELDSGLENIVRKLGTNNLMDGQKEAGTLSFLPLLEKLVVATMVDFENLKFKNNELSAKLLGSQKIVDELSNKVKALEDSNQARIVSPETIQEREASIASVSTQSEISEIQEMAVGKSNNVPLAPSAAHVRTLRKGSSDHLAITIDSDSERLINNMESDEDKGHAFKSLNTTGLIPRQGRAVADRVDGFWVTGSRALMSHPRGRLGLIAYWLVLHIWLLGTIL